MMLTGNRLADWPIGRYEWISIHYLKSEFALVVLHWFNSNDEKVYGREEWQLPMVISEQKYTNTS